jgi:hypothetical protein
LRGKLETKGRELLGLCSQLLADARYSRPVSTREAAALRQGRGLAW